MIYETILIQKENPTGIGWVPVILSNGIFKSAWFKDGEVLHEGGKPIYWLKEVHDTKPVLKEIPDDSSIPGWLDVVILHNQKVLENWGNVLQTKVNDLEAFKKEIIDIANNYDGLKIGKLKRLQKIMEVIKNS